MIKIEKQLYVKVLVDFGWLSEIKLVNAYTYEKSLMSVFDRI